MSSGTVVPIGLKTKMDDRLRIALEAMPVAVVWTRLDDGKVEFMNNRFIELFGFTLVDHRDVYGLIRAMFQDHEKAEGAVGALQSIIGQGVLETFHFPTEELVAVRKDKSTLYVSFSGIVVPEANMSLATFVDISEFKARESLLRRMAEEDPLTGLRNRRSFDLALASAIAQAGSEPLALIVMDLDGFKQVNDEIGHAAGDIVLRHVAGEMRQVFRKLDVMSRWGGDEFAVILSQPSTRADAEAALARLTDTLDAKITISGKEVRVGISAGVALYPEDARNMVDLYHVADKNMYRAKQHNRLRR